MLGHVWSFHYDSKAEYNGRQIQMSVELLKLYRDESFVQQGVDVGLLEVVHGDVGHKGGVGLGGVVGVVVHVHSGGGVG